MAPLTLSPRQRLELEYFTSHTPVARERCRAQASLWLDDGDSAEWVAELLHVGRRTVYDWVDRFHDRSAFDLRQRLADAPRPGRPHTGAVVSTPGSLRSSTRIRVPSAIARRSGPPPCWCDTYGIITRSRSRGRRSAGPSHAWESAGSGHGISWHSARRPGVRRKGAETRAGRPRPHGPAHAR